MVEQAPIGAWSTFTNTSSLDESSVKAAWERVPVPIINRIGKSSQGEGLVQTKALNLRGSSRLSTGFIGTPTRFVHSGRWLRPKRVSDSQAKSNAFIAPVHLRSKSNIYLRT